MRAILPGRPQATRQAFCTASWDGLRLVAYLSGNTAIILTGPQKILQTIHVDGVESLQAIAIEETSGKIAVCNQCEINIYTPVGREQADLRWAHDRAITVADNNYTPSLSWGSAEELLLAGSQLWLYHVPFSEQASLIWQQQVACSVAFAAFSTDAGLIATCGDHDRLVKIWRRLSYEVDSTRFDNTYLPHPTAVTNIHWRKPWHAQQSLDGLLYTFCADNQVRVWVYSDPHSLSVMQLVATVDLNQSIQPRRMSFGSMSRRRYAFVFDSRDFSRATEASIQSSRSTQIDHALEHLIELANRSPEIIVVFDGLGHMSAWGLENAGYKGQKPTVVFNVTLVDDINIDLKGRQDEVQDFVRFCAFAGGTNPANISLLSHCYDGQIDWYESPISHFFDTAPRSDRLRLVSSWSGHDLPVEHIARGSGGHGILSWTDEGQAILWTQVRSGALRRRCNLDLAADTVALLLLDEDNSLLVLRSHNLVLYDISDMHPQQRFLSELESSKSAREMQYFRNANIVAIIYEDDVIEMWTVSTASQDLKGHLANGEHPLLQKTRQTSRSSILSRQRRIPCDTSGITLHRSHDVLTAVTSSGDLHQLCYTEKAITETLIVSHRLQTAIRKPSLARSTDCSLVAVTDDHGKTLYIWNILQGVYEWKHIFGGPDHIQKMAWFSTASGHMLLFISFSYHALVIGQARYASENGYESWRILQDISLREFTTNYIGDVSWLSSGDLAIGAGNQVFVVETVVTRTVQALHRAASDVASTTAATRAVSIDNSALPMYHARVLEALLHHGDWFWVRSILTNLHERLKYFTDGDELLSFPDELFNSMVTGEPSVILNNVDVSATEIQLGELEASLREYLGSASVWQMSQPNRDATLRLFSTLLELEKHRDGIDANGLRYLYSFYMSPADADLPWSAFVFASMSTSQEALLEVITREYNGKITWSLARRTGLFLWLRDLSTLQAQFENVARNEYNRHEDRNPVDCSIYYLALDKKSILQGLWRRTIGVKERDNTMRLLANDFQDPKWKSTALKNAYALLSKRRFEYAAAFFLLSGSLKDAVNVCASQLNDLQLAIAVARVWERDRNLSKEVFSDLLERHVLEIAIDAKEGRWMAVWAYTALEKDDKAIQAICRPLHEVVGELDLASFDRPPKSLYYQANDPKLVAVFSEIRDRLIQQKRWTKSILAPVEEHDLLMRAIRWYIRGGMDLVALQLARRWKFIPYQNTVDKTNRLPSTQNTNGTPVKATKTADGQTEAKKKPPPTQFIEPSADSLLDSFGF